MTPVRPDPRVCDYCQSPLPTSWWARTSGAAAETESETQAQSSEPVYCCLGCRMASDIVQEKGEAGAVRGILTRLGLSIFFTMNVMAFTMALWTTDVYEAADRADNLLLAMHGLFRYLVLLFSLPVLVLLGVPLASSAWRNLRQGVISTDALLSLGVGAAFAASFWSVLRGGGHIYFEVGCVILVMTTLGRWLEATGRLKASSALDALARLLPETVRRVGSEGEQVIPLDQVARGDLLRILPGERFPADGTVERNSALVDEQVLTGESRPTLKEPGGRILGGTLNLDGDLVVRVGAIGAEGTLARVIELVKQARTAKGRYQRLVDQVSSWFFPVVACIALAAFAVHSFWGSIEQGLMAGLAVSLIACPCALGLATPLAVWSAIGQAAAHQVLFRGGEALERLAEVKAIRFDKTGTLTTGTAAVQSCLAEHPDEAGEIVSRAAALAASSSHSLSQAIVEFQTVNSGGSSERAEQVRVVPGRGVIGIVHRGCLDVPVSLGSPSLMAEQGLRTPPLLSRAVEKARGEGLSLSLVGWSDEVRGLFVFNERWRPGFAATIGWLRAAGLDVGVLTGDHAARGRAIARDLGVSVEAELLPDQKVDSIRRAQCELGPVAMVGDGVNDAPALAASDVGIALGCGTDVSRDSASICLLGDDLTRIHWTIELARRTIGVIRRNLFWAFGYNALGVIAAAWGWLNPAVAALLMVGSSAVVIGNSLRLRQPLIVSPCEPLGSGPVEDLAERRKAEIPDRLPAVLEAAP